MDVVACNERAHIKILWPALDSGLLLRSSDKRTSIAQDVSVLTDQGMTPHSVPDDGLRTAGTTRRQRRCRQRPLFNAEMVEQLDISIGLHRGCGVGWQGRAKIAKSGRSDELKSPLCHSAEQFDALIEAAACPVYHQNRFSSSQQRILQSPERRRDRLASVQEARPGRRQVVQEERADCAGADQEKRDDHN